MLPPDGSLAWEPLPGCHRDGTDGGLRPPQLHLTVMLPLRSGFRHCLWSQVACENSFPPAATKPLPSAPGGQSPGKACRSGACCQFPAYLTLGHFSQGIPHSAPQSNNVSVCVFAEGGTPSSCAARGCTVSPRPQLTPPASSGERGWILFGCLLMSGHGVPSNASL